MDFGRLLADRILQHIGNERSDSIRELHFLMFVGFFAFSNLRKVRGFRSSLGGPNYGRYRGEATFFFFPTLWTFFFA